MDSQNKTNGITLIELLITITIISVIVGIGLPQFNNMIKNNALITNTNMYIALLNYARTEAITRETNVVICATTNSTAAKPNCNSNNWENGWVLFSDIGDTPNNFDNNDIILKRAAKSSTRSSIRSTFTNVGRLTFAKTGLASSAGIISFCDDRGIPDSRAISISRVGRISSLGKGNASQCPTL